MFVPSNVLNGLKRKAIASRDRLQEAQIQYENALQIFESDQEEYAYVLHLEKTIFEEGKDTAKM